jgi:hypothetical protein
VGSVQPPAYPNGVVAVSPPAFSGLPHASYSGGACQGAGGVDGAADRAERVGHQVGDRAGCQADLLGGSGPGGVDGTRR